jgi:hypothetical protein
MRRFFLALGVRVEVVARPLPDVIQPPQGPAEGVIRDALVGEEFEGFLEQRHRPTRRRVAEILGRDGEEGFEQVLLVLIQHRVPPPARLVRQRGGVVPLQVGLDPVVDALPGDAEHPGDIGGWAAKVELQDGEGPPKEAGILGVGELTAEALPLPGGQFEAAHALLLLRCRRGS